MPGSYRDHGPKVLLPWANPDVDPAGPEADDFRASVAVMSARNRGSCPTRQPPASYPKSSTTTQRTEVRLVSYSGGFTTLGCRESFWLAGCSCSLSGAAQGRVARTFAMTPVVAF